MSKIQSPKITLRIPKEVIQQIREHVGQRGVSALTSKLYREWLRKEGRCSAKITSCEVFNQESAITRTTDGSQT